MEGGLGEESGGGAHLHILLSPTTKAAGGGEVGKQCHWIGVGKAGKVGKEGEM